MQSTNRWRDDEPTNSLTRAELLREGGDVLDDGHAHPPLPVHRQVRDGGQQGLREELHADYLKKKGD